MVSLNVWIAFGAGVVSFLSPCSLPLYPSYLSYITGVSVKQLRDHHAVNQQRVIFNHTLMFVLGFSVVFFTLGFGAGVIGELFGDYKDLIRKVCAVFMIGMGIYLFGLIKLKYFVREFKINIRMKPTGYVGSFLFGVGFSAGWSPCVGPILASIIALTVSEPSLWVRMISAYSLGFALPFIALSFWIGSSKRLLPYANIMMKLGGVMMVIVGILLYMDQFVRLTILLQKVTPHWLNI